MQGLLPHRAFNRGRGGVETEHAAVTRNVVDDGVVHPPLLRQLLFPATAPASPVQLMLLSIASYCSVSCILWSALSQ